MEILALVTEQRKPSTKGVAPRRRDAADVPIQVEEVEEIIRHPALSDRQQRAAESIPETMPGDDLIKVVQESNEAHEQSLQLRHNVEEVEAKQVQQQETPDVESCSESSPRYNYMSNQDTLFTKQANHINNPPRQKMAAVHQETLNASKVKSGSHNVSNRASLGRIGPSFAEDSEHLAYEKLVYQPLSTNVINYEEKEVVSPVNSDTEATKEAHVQEYEEPELPASMPDRLVKSEEELALAKEDVAMTKFDNEAVRHGMTGNLRGDSGKLHVRQTETDIIEKMDDIEVNFIYPQQYEEDPVGRESSYEQPAEAKSRELRSVMQRSSVQNFYKSLKQTQNKSQFRQHHDKQVKKRSYLKQGTSSSGENGATQKKVTKKAKSSWQKTRSKGLKYMKQDLTQSMLIKKVNNNSASQSPDRAVDQFDRTTNIKISSSVARQEAEPVKIQDSQQASKIKSLPETLRKQPEALNLQEQEEQPTSFFNLNFKSLATDGKQKTRNGGPQLHTHQQAKTPHRKTFSFTNDNDTQRIQNCTQKGMSENEANIGGESETWVPQLDQTFSQRPRNQNGGDNINNNTVKLSSHNGHLQSELN